MRRREGEYKRKGEQEGSKGDGVQRSGEVKNTLRGDEEQRRARRTTVGKERQSRANNSKYQ